MPGTSRRAGRATRSSLGRFSRDSRHRTVGTVSTLSWRRKQVSDTVLPEESIKLGDHLASADRMGDPRGERDPRVLVDDVQDPDRPAWARRLALVAVEGLLHLRDNREVDQNRCLTPFVPEGPVRSRLPFAE